MTVPTRTGGPARAGTRHHRLSRRVSVTAGAGLAVVLLAASCDSSGGSQAPSTPAGRAAAADTTSADAPVAPTTPTTATTPTRSTVTGSTTPAPTGGAAGAGRLGDAGATALAKLGRGTVTSIDLERGGTVWEVEITTRDGVEHEIHVSRDGSTVVSGPRTETHSAREKRENRREVSAAKLDYAQAARKALAARAGTVTELDLDDHRGMIVWEADVTRAGVKYELVIDAATGKVISNKPDTDDD